MATDPDALENKRTQGLALSISIISIAYFMRLRQHEITATPCNLKGVTVWKI